MVDVDKLKALRDPSTTKGKDEVNSPCILWSNTASVILDRNGSGNQISNTIMRKERVTTDGVTEGVQCMSYNNELKGPC